MGAKDASVEIEERRLDLAEKNIYEALRSDDPRRRDAEAAEPERLRGEDKTIEHDASPEALNKD